MHLALGHHTRAALLTLSLLGALSPGRPVSAAPVTQQDATQPMTGAVDPAELALEPAALAMDAGDAPGAAIKPTAPRATRIERPPSARPEPDLAADIRSTVKESVRPLRDQLLESGALEAWNDLKNDLGLSKNKWGNEGNTDAAPTAPGRLDTSHSASWQDPTNRPRTAAQAEVDREMAALMMEKLIDEVKPWVFSLVGLYLLGYLIKAGYDYSKRKSIRRRERETALALRRAARKGRRARSDL